MAALSPVVSIEALLSAIQKSGLVAPDKLEKIREAAAHMSDPKQLARDLIKGSTLTKWQAGQLLHGYHALVIGKYKLLDQLSVAPTGRIYLAEHAQIGRRHTLKVLAKRLASNPQAVKQFLSAAQNACGLEHRNISHVYDVNQEGDKHYVVMEHVEGEDLDRLVTRGGPVNLLQALDFIAQAAEGLAHAHENGVVHGDLKPANLLRDPSGTIKILEIGQTGTGVTPEAEGADESIEMAALAAVIFQSPELRGDGEVADVACDVYSLGSVLCFLLTGKAAPDSESAVQQLEAAKNIPAEVTALCRHWMAEKPADRPRTVAIVLDELTAAAQQLAQAKKQEGSAIAARGADKKEKGLAKGAEPSAKSKKPPVAKAVAADDDEAIAIVIPDEPQPVQDPEPIAAFTIKTRGRGGKKPATKSAAAAQTDGNSAAGEKEAQPDAEKKTYTPLILAGAIGGGGVLVLGLIITLVCLFTWGRGKTDVAQNGPAKAAAAANKGAATPHTEAESNPQASAEEKNPEVTPTVAIAPGEKATVGSSARTEPPLPGEPKSAETKPIPPPEVKPAPEAKPEPKPEPPPDPKPAPKPEAKPAPPKAPAKPEPFKGFAKAVSLPELPEAAGAQPMTGALDPNPLGPCKLDDQTPLAIVLHAGDTPVRGSKQKFELQPKAGAAGEWDVVLSGGGMPAVIAGLRVKDSNLQFQWTDEAVRQSPAARQLSNCALDMTAGAAQHNVALRTPVQGAPLVIEIDKPNPGVKWTLSDVPAPKQVFIQVTRVEEIKKYRQEPLKQPVSIGDSLVVWMGEEDKSLPLGLNLASSTTSRGVEIKLQPQVKLEGAQKGSPYRRKEYMNLHTQAAQELPLVQQQLEQAKRDRPSTNPAKAVVEKQLIDDRKAKLTVELEKRDALLKQLAFITAFAENFPGAKIHFRVYCQAGPTQIELLKTEEEAPKAKAK